MFQQVGDHKTLELVCPPPVWIVRKVRRVLRFPIYCAARNQPLRLDTLVYVQWSESQEDSRRMVLALESE